MNNSIFSALIKLSLLSLLIIFSSCEKVDLSDIEGEGKSGNENVVSIITRAASDIEYPIHLIAFDEGGEAAGYTIVENQTSDVSMSLDAGTYHIVAVSGIKECQAPRFNSADNNITMPESNRTSTPIQMGSTDIKVAQNATTTITLYNQVAAFDISLTDIPENVESVSVSMATLCNTIDLRGNVSGTTTTTFDLTRQADGTWAAPRFYTLPSSNDKMTISITTISPSGQETYGYTYNGKIKPNTPYSLTGSYDKGFTVNNVLTVAGWNKTEEISFTFGDGENNEDGSTEEEVYELPAVGSLWNNHLVGAIEYSSESTADIILLSLSEWSGISSAYNSEVPNMASDIAESYTEDGLGNWKIPTKDEAKMIRTNLGIGNFDKTNSMLKSNNYPVLKLGEDIENDVTIRYLCEGATYSFAWNEGSMTKAGGKRTYHLRLVNRIAVEIAE